MPRPRSQQVSLSDTPYYHCISRCVRRAFLCGQDVVTGKSFEHRRGWIEKRLLFLAQVFAIDVCAYAVMSNHIHVVLHVNEQEAKHWTTCEVIERWHALHKGTVLTQRYLRGEEMPKAVLDVVELTAETYRQRLTDISWLMRELNEPIARQANFEDGCTGRFWEGRFKSQALLDEAALIACMAYVDLNPLRAKIADTPEESEFTSVKKRVESVKKSEQPKALMPFIGNERENQSAGIAFKLKDYLDLVDLTGRVVRQDKRGSIDLSLSPILQRVGISHENWIAISTQFEKNSHAVVGVEQSLKSYIDSNPKARPNRRCTKLLA
ncbi:transposase [Marinomonas mediterranea]|uniref:transposase n=1 Tax=Marinomonas mediterranea TaxID=119864 RepID=UPI00234A1C78|nr:transposase [Marinomonas mediterranea]WCN10082.1 transposase [Marinomonas mediterranea]